MTGENRADLRLHHRGNVTEGRPGICTVNVTDGQGFCGVFVTEGKAVICAPDVTEGQREKE